MAIKRKLGVEFLSEGFKVRDERDAARQSTAAPNDDADRKRAFLTYGPALLRVLAANPSEPLPPRALFERVVANVGPSAVFQDFELALTEAFEQRFVEMAGKDSVFGDPLYAITRYGISVAPTAA